MASSSSSSSSASHGGAGDAWLVSFADFMTLLFVFFVVMYALAVVNVSKMEQLAKVLQAAIGGIEVKQKVDSQISGAMPLGEGQPAAIVLDKFPPKVPAMYDTVDELTQKLEESGLEGQVKADQMVEGTLLTFNDKLLFRQNSAQLEPTTLDAMKQLAEFLNTVPNAVRIVGHTDPAPPTDPRYPTNWDLSIARALAVVRYLVDVGGVDPARLQAQARAEFSPLRPNDSQESAALNRRVEIMIVNELAQPKGGVNPLEDGGADADAGAEGAAPPAAAPAPPPPASGN
ncbi:MAG: flagellar motor protein MotB [Chloroflexi bacterium]|nr:flagellar motor protein MotB [Chloroflexota bacterium]MDA1217497.1 flagellar motor protein MotB [Chloroflexota bacterium]